MCRYHVIEAVGADDVVHLLIGIYMVGHGTKEACPILTHGHDIKPACALEGLGVLPL